MVYYSPRAILDLDEIDDGLLTWTKHKLEYNHVVFYHNDIKDISDKIDSKIVHIETKYQLHRSFGKYVYSYRRNRNTTWYII